MKSILFSLCLLSLGSNSFAGDGYAATAKGISTILASSEVAAIASPFYVESIRQYGEILPSKMTYTILFQRDDLGDERFCLVVTVEGEGALKVSNIQKWKYNSLLCHN